MGTGCDEGLLLLMSLFASLLWSCCSSGIDAIGQSPMPTISLESALALHATMDKDSDGNVSLEDFVDFSNTVAQAQARDNIGIFIKTLDADRDGHVDWEELANDVRSGQTKPAEAQEADWLQFQTVDKDKDGRLNRTEAAAFFFPSLDRDVMHLWARRHVDALDTDQDGYLSIEEFANNKFQYADEDFAALDENGDELLSAAELRVHETGEHGLRRAMTEFIKLADTDASGHLSAMELENAYRDLIRMEAHDHLHQWANHMEL